MAATPSLLRSTLNVAWIFVVLGAAWIFASSRYDNSLIALAGALSPDRATVEHLGSSIAITLNDSAGRPDFLFSTVTLHSGLLVVLSLVLATPMRSVSWRVRMAAMALGGVFLVHALAVGLLAWALLRSAEGAWLLGDVLIGFAIFWGVAPALLGGFWVYRYWLPAFRARA